MTQRSEETASEQPPLTPDQIVSNNAIGTFLAQLFYRTRKPPFLERLVVGRYSAIVPTAEGIVNDTTYDTITEPITPENTDPRTYKAFQKWLREGVNVRPNH